MGMFGSIFLAYGMWQPSANENSQMERKAINTRIKAMGFLFMIVSNHWFNG
jgi:hypothetical protein